MEKGNHNKPPPTSNSKQPADKKKASKSSSKPPHSHPPAPPPHTPHPQGTHAADKHSKVEPHHHAHPPPPASHAPNHRHSLPGPGSSAERGNLKPADQDGFPIIEPSVGTNPSPPPPPPPERPPKIKRRYDDFASIAPHSDYFTGKLHNPELQRSVTPVDSNTMLSKNKQGVDEILDTRSLAQHQIVSKTMPETRRASRGPDPDSDENNDISSSPSHSKEAKGSGSSAADQPESRGRIGIQRSGFDSNNGSNADADASSRIPRSGVASERSDESERYRILLGQLPPQNSGSYDNYRNPGGLNDFNRGFNFSERPSEWQDRTRMSNCGSSNVHRYPGYSCLGPLKSCNCDLPAYVSDSYYCNRSQATSYNHGCDKKSVQTAHYCSHPRGERLTPASNERLEAIIPNPNFGTINSQEELTISYKEEEIPLHLWLESQSDLQGPSPAVPLKPKPDTVFQCTFTEIKTNNKSEPEVELKIGGKTIRSDKVSPVEIRKQLEVFRRGEETFKYAVTKLQKMKEPGKD